VDFGSPKMGRPPLFSCHLSPLPRGIDIPSHGFSLSSPLDGRNGITHVHVGISCLRVRWGKVIEASIIFCPFPPLRMAYRFFGFPESEKVESSDASPQFLFATLSPGKRLMTLEDLT